MCLPSRWQPHFRSNADRAYNTLHFASKVVCQRGYPLWKPLFCREAGIACIDAAVSLPSKNEIGGIGQPVPGADLCTYLLIWPLTVSPILTVLIYYFHMYRTFADSKLLRRLADSSLCLYNIITNFYCTLFNIIFQGKSPENTVFTMYACFAKIIIIYNSLFPTSPFRDKVIWRRNLL